MIVVVKKYSTMVGLVILFVANFDWIDNGEKGSSSS
jgi:hypothetical protein